MTKIGKIMMVVLGIILLSVAIFFLTKEPVVLVEENLGQIENNPELILDNQILGQKEDLISFSTLPGTKIPQGVLSVKGIIKGAWFFEANILINILDTDQNMLKAGNANAISDWMTVEPVAFEGNIDLTGLSTGPAYLEIRNDNPSALPENDKFIQIPIVIQ